MLLELYSGLGAGNPVSSVAAACSRLNVLLATSIGFAADGIQRYRSVSQVRSQERNPGYPLPRSQRTVIVNTASTTPG